MRPGRREDLPRLIELWRREVDAGRQDSIPNAGRLQRMLDRFDWESQSRVVEDGDGAIAGVVMVMARSSPEGLLATLNVAGAPPVACELARWGARLSQASGASIVQVFQARGAGELEGAGLRRVRQWWRMDHSLETSLPEPKPVAGYQIIDGAAVPPGAWGEMFNETFADHWRFVPRGEDEVLAGKPAGLCLMAVTVADREPAAITLGEVEEYPGDPRPQPVGLVSSVGTLPGHRRRGLASWLVAEVLVRLKAAGARSASLYVDGNSEMKAFEAYQKLGFEVTFESEVWEATFP